MNLKKLITELKRRNVIKASVAYLVVSWLILQIASIILPAFDAPPYAIKTLLLILSVGFPLNLIFSWIYELTPEGIKKTARIDQKSQQSITKNNQLNSIIIASVSIAIVLLVFNLFGNAQKKIENINEKSIAVLAFTDMSPNKDQEYFSDGISEELLNLLAKVPELKVISRTSSFSFKNKEITANEIGKQLDVAYILEGSIRKSDSSFRINTQLINTANGTQIWHQTYNHDMDDIFKIQDEIASEVIQRLKVTLLGEHNVTNVVNPDAYNLFLQAKQLYYQGSYEAGNNALKLIRQSQEIDSTYAPSFWLYSRVIFRQSFSYMELSKSEGIKLGKSAALKAIDLDPDLYLGYISLAAYNRIEWDFKSSNNNIEKALLLAPENSYVMGEAARNALDLGKIESAITLQEKAIVLDPIHYGIYYRLAMSYAWTEQYKKAELNLQKFILMYPNFPYAHGLMSEILLKLGRNDEVLVEIEKESDPYWKLYRKCMILYALGNISESNLLLKELIDNYGDRAWSNIAEVYAYKGEIDEAFKWLELCYDKQDSALHEVLNYPAFKSLYKDPRWNAFINKLELPKNHGFHLE